MLIDIGCYGWRFFFGGKELAYRLEIIGRCKISNRILVSILNAIV